MTYYGAKDLAEAFRTVRKNTIAIAKDVPEDKYEFRVAPDTRTIAHMLVHLAAAPSWQQDVHSERMTSLEGFDFPGRLMRATADERMPRTKAQIIDLLETTGEAFAVFVEGLSESDLAETVAMPARSGRPPKTRFEMLLSVKEHEMHHRGQLMLMERQLGIVPHMTREMEARFARTAQPATM